ncbi:MAG: SCO family protein [Planctomycetes bacterium]|nr:SCO family protein [Planctomycetota bacterium]
MPNSTQQQKHSPSPWLLGFAVLALVILVPRLPVLSNKTLHASSLPAVETPYLLVTFGFAGCGTICPGQLARLQEVVDAANNVDPIVSAAFVNMNASGTAAVTEYVQALSTGVIAVSPSRGDLQELLNEFGVQYYGDTESNGPIEHRGDVFLLSRAGEDWNLIQSFPGDSLNIKQAIAALDTPPSSEF